MKRAKWVWGAVILLVNALFGGNSSIVKSSFSLSIPDARTDPEGYARWKAEYARSLSRRPLARAESPMELRVNNGYVEAVVDNESGEFDEGGDPTGSGSYVKLTYSYTTWSGYSGGTEWVMYYVDGYTAKTDSDLPAPDACYVSGDTVITIWENWHGVRIRQEILPVSLSSTPGASEHILFRAKMYSADGAEHECGCLVYYDTMLDTNDGAPISTSFGYVGYTQMFFASDSLGIPPIWHAYEFSFPPSPGDLVATGILRGWEAVEPDVFWYGNWPESVGNGWDDTEWSSLVGHPFSDYHDTAVMVKWYPRVVSDADSVVFATYYGLGVVEGDFVFDHTPPELTASCSDVHPNPMPLTVQISNGLLETVNDVYAYLDLTGTDLELVSGDNPAHFDSIAGFGGTQVVEWNVEATPDAYGTTQCYTITVVSTPDSIHITDTFCVDIPELITIDASVWADEYWVEPGATVGLHSSVDWSGGTGELTYHWEPASLVDDPSSPNPTATVDTTTTFILTVSDTGDCIGVDSVTIFMQKLDTVWFSEETECDGQNVVEICYVLRGEPGDISVAASTDGGASWDAPISTLEDADDDLGEAIRAGTHCFNWVVSEDLPDTEIANLQIAIQLGGGEGVRFTTAEDFRHGEFSHINLLSPDPDGTDDGALWIQPGSDTIKILQVYPDGHCTDCMSSAIYEYMRDGTPPLNLKIYLMPISEFNASATSPASTLSVSYIDETGTIHSPEDMVFSDFDVVMFGSADSYGGYDLTPASADVVRAFCQMGKGLLLTHDTAGCSPTVCMPNFCSLSDISGISCVETSSWTTFTQVVKVTTEDLPLLHIPFEIPDTFNVNTCHWKGQVIENGWFLYQGIGSPANPDDNLLYWQAYHNAEYNSFSSFYSYGHRETPPSEWEAKAMINSIFYSYHGGIGSGVYTSDPVEFSSDGGITVAWNADVPAGAFINVEVALDTCIGDDECWTQWYEASAVPDLAFDQFKYRIGMSPNDDGESPVLHWIEFSTGALTSDTIFAVGPVDTRPPEVSPVCPADTVQYGDTISLAWSIDDMFPNTEEPCTVFVNYCVGEDTFITSTPVDWSPEPIVCDSAFIAVAAPDSFCNWGYDTCYFTIVSAGSMVVHFPETSAYACDTIYLPLTASDRYLPLASNLEIFFSVNGAILTPIDFSPSVSPAPDSAWFDGSGNHWVVGMRWLSRVFIESDTLGMVGFEVNCAAEGGDFSPLHFDSVRTGLMDIITDDGLVAVNYTPHQWLQILRFDDPSGEKPTATLGFGNAFAATDYYDPAYDIIYVTPPPSEIKVWFALDDPDHPAIWGLSRDIKDTIPVNRWVVINEEDRPLYVHWNPRLFDEGLYLLNGYQDMRADTDYITAPGETLVITWSLPEWESAEITLHRGWNLVSVPVRNPSGSPESVFPGVFFGPLGYDAESRSFYLADHIDVGTGYWVFSLNETQIPLIGLPVHSYEKRVYSGWNLVGATIDTLPTDTATVDGGSILSIFEYDPATGGYYPTTELVPGKGYWIWISGAGILRVPGE